MSNKLKVTLKRSVIGRKEVQKRTVKALGFHRTQETRILPDNPAIRGMIDRVRHLVEWETVSE
jgi:large subunit ribosomal protein L30